MHKHLSQVFSLSAGFDWSPLNDDLWATTNGRDNLNNANGTYDDRPDDFLAWIPMPGLDFGFPYCHWTGAPPFLPRRQHC